jgi:hypothetical protein
MMRLAGCLVNPITNAYCMQLIVFRPSFAFHSCHPPAYPGFAEAVAQISPADVYYYSLPLGTNIPSSTVPSCSACIQTVLGIYVEYATNETMPISHTYSLASTKANAQCGANYSQILNVSPVVSKSSSEVRRYIAPLILALGYDTGGPLLVIGVAVSILLAGSLSL